jgi:hypothetical protein
MKEGDLSEESYEEASTREPEDDEGQEYAAVRHHMGGDAPLQQHKSGSASTHNVHTASSGSKLGYGGKSDGESSGGRGEWEDKQGERGEPWFAVHHASNSGGSASSRSAAAGNKKYGSPSDDEDWASDAEDEDTISPRGPKLKGDAAKQLWKTFEKENSALFQAAQSLVQNGDPIATNKLLQELEKEMEADEQGTPLNQCV